MSYEFRRPSSTWAWLRSRAASRTSPPLPGQTNVTGRQLWRLQIIEQKYVYYDAETLDEAMELLRSGNEPEREDTMNVFIADEGFVYFVPGLVESE